MRTNRIIRALHALGGTGTTQDITAIVRARPECVSAQLAGMARRGAVAKRGSRVVRVRRWCAGAISVRVTVWCLQ